MWRNALVVTIAVESVLFLTAVICCRHLLLEYKWSILGMYGAGLLWFWGLLAFNMFAGYILFTRKFFKKETGSKLAHVEREVKSGSISQELGDALRAEKQ
jgi:hypothetical protein